MLLDDSGLQVYAPRVNEHSYKAGCWGQEVRLIENTTMDKWNDGFGVPLPPVYKSLDNTTNAVLHNKKVRTDAEKACFFSFSTPLPTDIVSLRRVKLKPNANLFDGADATGINRDLQTYSLIHVLVYRFAEPISLRQIPSISWKDVYKNDSNLKADDAALLGADNRLMTLHYFAEPDTEIPEYQRAFDRIVGLFESVDLSTQSSSATAKADRKTPLPGFNGWEEQTLLERSSLRHHSKCTGIAGEGHNPANCGKLFVDNRSAR